MLNLNLSVMSNFFMEVNLIDLSDEDGRRALHAEEGEPETDEERLEKLKKIRDTLRQVMIPADI